MTFISRLCHPTIRSLAVALVVISATTPCVAQRPRSFRHLARQFSQSVQPLLKQYCRGCHGIKSPQADFNIARFRSLADVRRDPAAWQKILLMVSDGEMPPKSKKQLGKAQAQTFLSWIRQYLRAEAHARAGDPGPVILRRLNNAELSNTIEDLTGVDLNPTEGLPADSAGGEGFTNTGDSLVMSPALLEKYLGVAQKLAAHVVLLPDGIRFSSSPHRRDWQQQPHRTIRAVYRRHTGDDGLLPVDRYLRAALTLRSQGGLEQVNLHQFAQQHKLSPTALRHFWSVLNTPTPSANVPAWHMLDRIRIRWQRTTPANLGALIAFTQKWQRQLWTIDPLTVGWYGKWQNRKPFISATTTLQIKVPKSQPLFRVYLVAAPANKQTRGSVLWQRPRFEASGKPPLLLSSLVPDLPYRGDRKSDLRTAIASRRLLTIPAAKVAGRTFKVDVVLERPSKHLVHVRLQTVSAAWPDLAFPRKVTIKGRPRAIRNQLNGHPVVRFAKDDFVMVGDSPQLRLPAFEITAVVKFDKSQGGPVRSIYNNYNNPINWGKGVSLQLTADGRVYFFTTAGTRKTYGQLYSRDRLAHGFHVVTASYTARRKRIFVDGKLVASTQSKGLDYGDGTRAAIGALREFKQDLQSDLAELLVFSGVNDGRRKHLESSLGKRYAIAIKGKGAVGEVAAVVRRFGPSLWFCADQFRSPQQSLPNISATTHPPLLGDPTSAVYQRAKSQEREFRNAFPLGLCYTRITPLNPGQITLRVQYREDDWLQRLVLNQVEQRRLDQAWRELEYISQAALREHHSFDVFLGFTTQVSKEQTAEFELHREPIRRRAETLRKRILASHPRHVQAALHLASRAWRRPLTKLEQKRLRRLYAASRSEGLTHEVALRQLVTQIFVSPNFLYRLEQPAHTKKATPVNAWELATRLSYFLWATLPDDPLRNLAKRNQLSPQKVLQESRRMMKDARIRGLATEFACQWLGLHDFSTDSAKNERLYPSFAKLRGDMHEEVVRFFVDLFQRDGSILEILDSDHTFLSPRLAKHYGLSPGRIPWQRVTGLKSHGRGGLLGMAAVLAKQSGASRTSPVLRGNWIVETLLGERIPNPPVTVPQIPDQIRRAGLTVRQLTERHARDPSCARCHVRIDPFGFALESFDAIGRLRKTDLLGKPVETRSVLRDGTKFQGISGLREYLRNKRRDDFVRQFCRKLLGYSLGRAVQLSDQPLITAMMQKLKESKYRVSTAVEAIVLSRQFRYIRGQSERQAR